VVAGEPASSKSRSVSAGSLGLSGRLSSKALRPFTAAGVGATGRVPRPSMYRIARAEASANNGLRGISGFITEIVMPGYARISSMNAVPLIVRKRVDIVTAMPWSVIELLAKALIQFLARLLTIIPGRLREFHATRFGLLVPVKFDVLDAVPFGGKPQCLPFRGLVAVQPAAWNPEAVRVDALFHHTETHFVSRVCSR